MSSAAVVIGALKVKVQKKYKEPPHLVLHCLLSIHRILNTVYHGQNIFEISQTFVLSTSRVEIINIWSLAINP